MKQRFLTLIAVSLLGVITLANTGNTQSRSDWRDILVRVSELEGEVRALKADVSGADGSMGGGQQTLLADMEVRIGQLEAEIRRLTGQIEEILYTQAQIKKDLELFRREVDLRFQDLSTQGAVEAITPDQPIQEDDPLEVQTGLAAAPSMTLPEGSPEDQYNFAFAFLRRSDFSSAEAAFEAFLEAHPSHGLAGNAQYWLGETYYVRKDYPEAAAAFLKGFQTYGDGNKGPDSLLKLGMSLSSMNQTEQACSAFEELLSRYTEASEAVLAQARLQQDRLGCS